MGREVVFFLNGRHATTHEAVARVANHLEWSVEVVVERNNALTREEEKFSILAVLPASVTKADGIPPACQP